MANKTVTCCVCQHEALMVAGAYHLVGTNKGHLVYCKTCYEEFIAENGAWVRVASRQWAKGVEV